MRKYWEQIPGDMFDFRKFYQGIANSLPNDARICEVGVADGKSAIFLAEAMANRGKTFKLTMIDNLDYGNTGQLTEILRNIQKSGLTESIEFLPLDSLSASCLKPDNYWHFVFIDASHKYEQTKADIRLWFNKLLPNHSLAGHDYNTFDEVNLGVYAAVNEVIPPEHLRIHETDKGYGVWEVNKSNGSYIK
jgi:cephalosporin hydroxylase